MDARPDSRGSRLPRGPPPADKRARARAITLARTGTVGVRPGRTSIRRPAAGLRRRSRATGVGKSSLSDMLVSRVQRGGPNTWASSPSTPRAILTRCHSGATDRSPTISRTPRCFMPLQRGPAVTSAGCRANAFQRCSPRCAGRSCSSSRRRAGQSRGSRRSDRGHVLALVMMPGSGDSISGGLEGGTHGESPSGSRSTDDHPAATTTIEERKSVDSSLLERTAPGGPPIELPDADAWRESVRSGSRVETTTRPPSKRGLSPKHSGGERISRARVSRLASERARASRTEAVAGDPECVVPLARVQSRELDRWLRFERSWRRFSTSLPAARRPVGSAELN